MTIRHHPSAETMAACVAGSLDLPRRLVVASHLEHCRACRRLAGDLEEAGGAMLEALPAAEMRADALAHTLARIDGPVPPALSEGRSPEPGLPACLRPYELGAWRWLGPGLEIRPILLPQPQAARLFLLKAKPGTRLPQHSHGGGEFTSVLTGAFVDESGRFGPGDFEEADEDMEHRPVVALEGACMCLVALEGRMKLSGFLGTLLGPFMRM